MSLLRRLIFNLRYFSKAPWDSGISPPELLEFILPMVSGNKLYIEYDEE
jgi:hypothetical protein